MFAKNWRRGISAVLSASIVFSAGLLGGCQGQSASSSREQVSSSSIDLSDEYYIDPETMEELLDEIYENTPELLRESVSEPTEEEIEEVLKLSMMNIDDYFIRYSSGSFGLADIYIIKPASDAGYALKEELEELRERRIDEFEQYDVYDALAIAQNSEVTQIGTYVLLVMMEDAEDIISQLKPVIPTGY